MNKQAFKSRIRLIRKYRSVNNWTKVRQLRYSLLRDLGLLFFIKHGILNEEVVIEEGDGYTNLIRCVHLKCKWCNSVVVYNEDRGDLYCKECKK